MVTSLLSWLLRLRRALLSRLDGEAVWLGGEIPPGAVERWERRQNWIGPGGQKGLRPSYELAALFAQPEFAIEDRGLPDIRRCKWSGFKQNHPAEKPTQLLAWLVESGGGLVLDPFMGSGSTLVAAKANGSKAIGIEIEERYCEIAARRLAQEVLFDAPSIPVDDGRDAEGNP